MSFIKYIKQEYDKDCGLACLKMIAEYHHRSYDLLKKSNVSKGHDLGFSLQDLTEMAESIGLLATAIKANVKVFADIHLPVILHWNRNHYVVLYNIQLHNYHIADPAIGIYQLKEKAFLSHWVTIGNTKSDKKEGIIMFFSSQ